MRRLFASKAGFTAFTQVPGVREQLGSKVNSALRRGNDAVSHAAIETIATLMCPMHDNYDLKIEQLNKTSLLSSTNFITGLLVNLKEHTASGTGALVVSALLDFFTFAICEPFSDTTEGRAFENTLKIVSGNMRELFTLFQRPSLAIGKSAGLIMKALVQEADEDSSKQMQELALSEGALPYHLQTAIYPGLSASNSQQSNSNSRMLAKRELSRQLISLWVTDHEEARDLLTRIFPAGLTTFLYSDDDLPDDAFKQSALDNRDNLAIAGDTKTGAVVGVSGVVGETLNDFMKSEQVQCVQKFWSDSEIWSFWRFLE